MDGSSLAVAGVVVSLTFHVACHGHRVRDIISLLWPSKGSDVETEKFQHARATQVETELWRVRARMYRAATTIMVHCAFFNSIGFLYEVSLSCSFTTVMRLVSMAGVYCCHHMVLTERIPLTRKTLRTMYILYYLSFVIFVLVNIAHQDTDARAVSMQVFNDGSRLILSVVFLDTRVTLPAQFAISVAETFVYWMGHEDASDAMAFAAVQCLQVIGTSAVSAILQFWVSSHINALLDAESMVGSFRRMLRGVCDGEVLLSENMTICENAECIKHLLMTSSNFKGKDFGQLLMEDEPGRFRAFMQQSTAEGHKPEEMRTRAPRCLRVSLRGAADIRVGVDLWHVPMPHLFGKDGPHHLLALREDWETRGQPEAAPAVSRVKLAIPAADPKTVARSEASSTSQSSFSTLVHHFPELVDMTLLVDGSSHWLDVEQAHLRYIKQPSEPDACMPCLRKLVRPTDWETVRSKLSNFVNEVAAGSAPENLHMKLRMMDDNRRPVIANSVEVSAFTRPRAQDAEPDEPSMSLCLHLTGIAFDETRKKTQPSLVGIDEFQRVEEEEEEEEAEGSDDSNAETQP